MALGSALFPAVNSSVALLDAMLVGNVMRMRPAVNTVVVGSLIFENAPLMAVYVVHVPVTCILWVTHVLLHVAANPTAPWHTCMVAVATFSPMVVSTWYRCALPGPVLVQVPEPRHMVMDI